MSYRLQELGQNTTYISEDRNKKNHVVLGGINEYPGFGMVYDLFVDSGDRGRGKGLLLAREAINLAREKNLKGVITEVKVDNAIALKTFEKLGFNIIGTFSQGGQEYYRLSLPFSD